MQDLMTSILATQHGRWWFIWAGGFPSYLQSALVVEFRRRHVPGQIPEHLIPMVLRPKVTARLFQTMRNRDF